MPEPLGIRIACLEVLIPSFVRHADPELHLWSGPRNGRTAIATQTGDQLPKLFQGHLQVSNDLLRQNIRVRQVLGI
ncbi:MAG: hypothetical protein ACYDHY_09000 [Acidiferrobacterales bacterium]